MPEDNTAATDLSTSDQVQALFANIGADEAVTSDTDTQQEAAQSIVEDDTQAATTEPVATTTETETTETATSEQEPADETVTEEPKEPSILDGSKFDYEALTDDEKRLVDPLKNQLERAFHEKTREVAAQRNEVAPLADYAEARGELFQQLFQGTDVESSPALAVVAAANTLGDAVTDPDAAKNLIEFLSQFTGEDEVPQAATEPASDDALADLPDVVRKKLEQLDALVAKQDQAEKQQQLAAQTAAQEAKVAEIREWVDGELNTLKGSPKYKDFTDTEWDMVESAWVAHGGDLLPYAEQLHNRLVAVKTAATRELFDNQTEQVKVGAGEGRTVETPIDFEELAGDSGKVSALVESYF